ncbi:MAG: pyridoxal-phosphate dependent enzyme [Flavobacteriales bacterium]|nr:pyridoxal-phosphate dependent enzyme [Flavobacteriales bacterium]
MSLSLENLHKSKPNLQKLQHDSFVEAGIELFVLRLDEIHPIISGNKWYKLKYNLIEAQKIGKLLTFGGAYSNHIFATAWAAHQLGLKSVGIIRGEETLPLNHTLSKAKEWGMEIHYISRTEYRNKNDEEFVNLLKAQFGECFVVSEGGANDLGVKGAEEILQHTDLSFNHVVCSVGTGAMMAGIVNSVREETSVTGYASLKGASFLNEEVARFLKGGHQNWSINLDYHFGGYAKTTDILNDFIEKFEFDFEIKLDRIYNGKMFFGLMERIRNGGFKAGNKIVAIHCGGGQN